MQAAVRGLGPKDPITKVALLTRPHTEGGIGRRWNTLGGSMSASKPTLCFELNFLFSKKNFIGSSVEIVPRQLQSHAATRMLLDNRGIYV